MALDGRWVKGLSEQEKKAFLQQLDYHSKVLERLAEILEEEEKSLLEADNNLKEYDSPNWQYLKADRAGAIRTIRSIKKLTAQD